MERTKESTPASPAQPIRNAFTPPRDLSGRSKSTLINCDSSAVNGRVALTRPAGRVAQDTISARIVTERTMRTKNSDSAHCRAIRCHGVLISGARDATIATGARRAALVIIGAPFSASSSSGGRLSPRGKRADETGVRRVIKQSDELKRVIVRITKIKLRRWHPAND